MKLPMQDTGDNKGFGMNSARRGGPGGPLSGRQPGGDGGFGGVSSIGKAQSPFGPPGHQPHKSSIDDEVIRKEVTRREGERDKAYVRQVRRQRKNQRKSISSEIKIYSTALIILLVAFVAYMGTVFMNKEKNKKNPNDLSKAGTFVAAEKKDKSKDKKPVDVAEDTINKIEDKTGSTPGDTTTTPEDTPDKPSDTANPEPDKKTPASGGTAPTEEPTETKTETPDDPEATDIPTPEKTEDEKKTTDDPEASSKPLVKKNTDEYIDDEIDALLREDPTPVTKGKKDNKPDEILPGLPTKRKISRLPGNKGPKLDLSGAPKVGSPGSNVPKGRPNPGGPRPNPGGSRKPAPTEEAAELVITQKNFIGTQALLFPPGSKTPQVLNFQKIGDNTYSTKIEPGRYVLRLVKPMVPHYEVIVKLKNNQKMEINSPLKDPEGNASLTIITKPKGATVYIGRKKVGVTPLTLKKLLPRRYVIMVVKAGYKTRRSTVKFVKNAHRTKTLRLIPK